ncbi:OmpH family outer membrane protein [Dysgonomonas sp. 521]|uniref:OmpH family outer membrane protein n=1 Tax=Dysgonomonas sp. 521 TaxID=2302932 RepID=UPI0013D116C2|nr:OmpH family outer membrane protein [Dysgonomonas sp. 521]NDV94679.1 OmpH family outer membrane protein [Dysgonomonas sp. 521]
MLKKLFLLLLVVAPLAMFAQDKFAYVNAEEVFSKMPELKDVESKLATKSESIRKNAAAIEEEYNNKVKAFQNTPTDSLTEAIVVDRQKQLEDLQTRYQTFLQTSQQEYEKEQQTLITPLQEKLRKAINDVGSENSYTYILNAGALLYVNPSSAVDAGPKVKAKLGITN